MNFQPELIPVSISGDLRRGGWLVQGRVEGDTDAVHAGLNWIIDGRSLADFVDPDWREALNVHVLDDPDFQFTRHGSVATFQAGTADRFLAREGLQDISLAEVASPAHSHEATAWDFGLAVQHVLTDHCNFVYDPIGAAGSPQGWLTELDIDTTSSTAFEVFKIDADYNSMWRPIQKLGGGEEGGAEFYRPYFDRLNVFHYNQAPPFLSPQPSAKGTLTKEHIRGTVQVRLNNANIGQVQIKALYPQWTVTSSSIFNSSYPASPGNGKIVQKLNGVYANNQSRADTLAERLYRWLTRAYTLTVEVDPGLVLFGDDGRGLDLGDRLLVTYDGPAEDTSTGAGVDLNLNAQSMFVYAVDIRPDPARRRAVAKLTLEHDNSS